MADVKPLLHIDSKCSCGAHLFIELNQDGYLTCERLVSLVAAWTNAHAKHHIEPKAKA